jgi:glycosyltransferase involved in cell wall biosynthesis
MLASMNPLSKPVVVYLHRYPPEIEVLQWPALRELADTLAPEYELVYWGMGPANGKHDPALRRNMRVVELPFCVDQANGRDKLRKTLRWYLRLGRTLREIQALRPAAIICKEMLPFIPGRVVRTGWPVALTISDWWWTILLGHTRWGRWLAARLERFEVRTWNRTNVRMIVNSETERRLVVMRGGRHELIHAIGSPLNPDLFRPVEPRPAKDSLGLDGKFKHFAIFGIIRKGKGYEQLLDWWRLAAARHPDWRLVIIGGAGGEDWCRAEIAKRGLAGATHMTGWLPTKEDVNRWLNAMDAVIVYRRNTMENRGAIPSALSNGLATGRPVVATGLPGIAEFVHDGVDGFLFTPDDGEAFMAALERVVADPARAAAIGRAGRARAEACFAPGPVARAHLALIRQMTGPV